MSLTACRLCLAVNRKVHLIANTTLQDVYEKLTYITLQNPYGKPVYACYICYNMLKKIHIFTERAIKADQLLRNIIKLGIELTDTTLNTLDTSHLQPALVLSGFEIGDFGTEDVPGPGVTYEQRDVSNDRGICMYGEDTVELKDPQNPMEPSNEYRSESPDSDDMLYIDLMETQTDTDNINMEKRTDWDKGEESDQPQVETHTMDGVMAAPPQCTCLVALRDVATETTAGDQFAVEVESEGMAASKEQGIQYENTYSLDKESEIGTEDGIRITTEDLSDKFSVSSETANNDTASNLKCEICNLIFESRVHFICHMKKHEFLMDSLKLYKDKPFKCDQCGKYYTSKSNLMQHIFSHTKIKPFRCTKCDKVFARNSSLKHHLSIIHDEKRLRCGKCLKSFTLKSSFLCHVCNNPGENSFRCDYCDKTFSFRIGLNHHMKIHTIGKPYGCHLCDSAFSHKSTLVRHIRMHS